MKNTWSSFMKRAMAMVLAAVLVLSNAPLSTIHAHADDGNLIVNGDFDENIEGWKSAPVGNSVGSFSWEDGAACLSAEEAFGMETQTLIAVNATGTYSLSYKAEVSQGGVLYAYVDFYTADGAAAQQSSARLDCAVNGPEPGKKCSGEFEVPADAAQVSIRFELCSSQGEEVTAAIDQVKMYCEKETGSALNAQNMPVLSSAYDAAEQKLLRMILRSTYPSLGFRVDFEDGEELPWTLWSGATVAGGIMTQSADSNGYAEGTVRYAVDPEKTYTLSSSINAVGRAQAVYWVWEYDENDNQIQTVPFTAYYSKGSGGFVDFVKEYTPSANTDYVLIHLQTNEGRNRGGSVQWEYFSIWAEGEEPETTEPETTEPETTEPETTEPETTVPETTEPETTEPETTVPETTAPAGMAEFALNVSFADGEALPWTLWSGATVADGVMTQSADSNGYAEGTVKYAVDPEKTYTLSSSINAVGRAQAVYWVWEYDENNNQLNTLPFTAYYSSGSGGYVDFVKEYTPSADTAYVLFHLQTNEGRNKGGSVQWDYVQVWTKGEEPETTEPETTVPETTQPDATDPETTVPETTLPDIQIDPFEMDIAFEDGEALPWNLWSGASVAGGVLTMSADANGYAEANTPYSVEQGQTYTVTASINVTGRAQAVYWFWEYDASGNALTTTPVTKFYANGSGGAVQFTTDYTPSANTAYVLFHLQANEGQNNGGSVQWEYVTVAEKSAGPDTTEPDTTEPDTTAPEEDMPLNGDFEQAEQYWSFLLQGTASCTVEEIDGSNVLKMDLPADGQAYAYCMQVPVKPNYVYTVSYKVKITPDDTENLMRYGAISVIQEFSDSGVTGYEQSGSARNVTDGWETVTYDFITASNAKNIRLDLVYVNNPGVALFDDVTIVEKQAYDPEVLDAEYDHGGTEDTANPDNIITNATFDGGDITGWSPKEGVSAVQTENGGGVIRFNVKPGLYLQSAQFDVQGESVYELTYYVKAEDADNLEFMSYFFTTQSGTWNDFVSNKVTENTGGAWKKVTVQFTTPVLEDGVKGYVGFKALHPQSCGWQKENNDADCDCGSSGTVYLDDISLIRTGDYEDPGDGRVTPDSLVLNGTFDLDNKYWDYIESGEGVCSVETEDGNKVLQMKVGSAGQAYTYCMQVSVKPNYVYTVSYKVKITPDNTENLMKYGAISSIREFTETGSTGFEQSSSARNITDGWETVSYEYITSSAAKTIRLDLMYVNNPGVAMFDDISIVEKASYEPEVLGAEYDHGGTEDTANPDNIITNATFDGGDITGWSPKEGISAVQTENGGGVVRFNIKPGIYLQSNDLAVQGESAYELTYYVKAEDADNLEFMSYFFTTQSGTWNDFVSNKVTENTDGAWKKVTVQFTTPVLEDGVKGYVGFKALHPQSCGWQKENNDADCDCGSSGTVYLDDISLIRTGYAEDKGDGKVSDDSLVLNGTFDLGSKYWDVIIKGDGQYSIDESADGSSMKMQIGADGQVYAFSQQVAVKPNYVYTVSYKVKVTPDSAEDLMKYGAITIIQEFSENGVTGHEQSSTARNKTDGWETVTFDYSTSSTARFIRIDFQYANNPGAAWWDDFSIVEKAPYEPEVLDSKYDHGGTADTASADNVIGNSTFDNGSITGWSPKEGVAAVQTANGGGVVRFNVKPGIYMQSAQLKVQGESEYELTYYVKIEDAENLEFMPYFFTTQEGTWKDLTTAIVSENTNGRWKKVQVRFVTPVLAEGTDGFVGFKVIHTQACAWQKTQNDADCTCNGSGTIYLDDISLIRTGEVTDIGDAYAEEGSILYNGSFDRYFTDKYTVDGWNMNQVNPNHDTYIQSQVSHSGNAIAINATGHSYIWANDFTIEPGSVYILSYWIKVDKADGLKFAPYMNNGNYGGGWWLDDAVTPIYETTDGWIKVSGPVSIPASVGNSADNPENMVQLGFQVYEGSGTIYLDDVSFVKTDIDANDPNLDFELSEEILYNWSSASYGGKGNVTPSNEVHAGSDGKVSAKIYNSVNDGNTVMMSQLLPVQPKTTYEFSYWVRIDGTYDSTCTPHFRQIAEDGQSSATSIAWDGNNLVTVQSEMISPFWLYQIRGKVGWQQVSMSVTTGPDTYYLQLRMSVMGDDTSVYVDDISLVETIENVNLDFELTSSVTGAPANWYLSGGGSTKIVSEADTTRYHSGDQSYHIMKDSLFERTYVDSCAFIPVSADKTYEFSFWVSSKNCSPTATIRMNLQLYTADGTRLYLEDGNYRTMQGTVASLNSSDEYSQWTKVTTRAKPVSEAAYATINFTITRGTADVYIDDIFFNVVEDDTDCVVYYDDFHALDQDGNTGDWTLETSSGEASFSTGDGGKLTVISGESAIYNEMKQIMTEYSYTVRANYASDIGGKLEVRFYDFHRQELTDNRVEAPIFAGGEEVVLSFTAPSCAYTRLYFISDQAGTLEMKDVTVYMVAKPAKSSDWDGMWVWYPEDPVDDAVEEYRYFRYTFTLEDEVEYAPFQLTVDDKYAFYLNGELIDENWDAGQDSWANVASYDLTDKVKKGENIIALKCYNLVSEAALLFDGKFTLQNQSTAIVASDFSVKGAKTVDEQSMDWIEPDYDDSSWTGCKEYGQPPCSPWGPVFYDSTLYINNVAEVISTEVPESVTAGRDLIFTVTLKLEKPIEASFTPTVTVYKRNSIDSITSIPMTLDTYENPLHWPVGEEFEVQCRVSIPDYMESGKYTLQMDENMLLLTGDSVYDNKFLDFSAVETSSGRDNVVSSVEVYNGVPTLIIDGEPVASHFYLRPDLNVYLQTDAETRIYKSGLELYITYGGGLYKGGCGTIWREDGTIDYDLFDSVIYETLAANNDALVMVNIGMFAPPWWIEQNPDHELLCHNGSEYIAIDGEVSLASEKFREEAGEVLRLLIRHMKEQSYYNRVYGLKISGGQSYEWMIRGTGTDQGPDYSPVSVEGFKKYLKEKYGTEEELQKAWGNSAVTFETAAAPGWDERNNQANIYSGDAETGELSRNIVDWNLYLNEASTDSFLYYCQIAKEETDGQIIVGGYNGYLWTSNSYDSQGMAHTSMNRVLNSEYVDWISSPIAYNERLFGESNTYMPLLDSVQEHGKLYIAEQDNRTVLSSSYAGAPWDADWDFSVGQTRTIADTILQQKRDFANALINGAGLWQFDMYGGWLDDDQIYQYISEAKAEYDYSVYVDRDVRSEVAIFVGDETYAYMRAGQPNMPYSLFEPLLMQQRKHLAAMGTSYDTYAMSSLLDGTVEPHKLNIIFTPFEITDEMNEAIDKYLKCDGQYVVWVYLPGISDGTTLDADYMTRVTGFEIGLIQEKSGLQVQIADTNNVLTQGIEGLIYGNSGINAVSPMPYIKNTDGVEVLGYNLDGNQAAGLGIKDMGDWVSIYSAAPCLDVALLRNLLKLADCHVYSDNNEDVIYASNCYVALHSATAEEKTITLPGNYAVYDVFEKEFISMDTDTITYDHEENETHIFRLMTPNTYSVTARIKSGKGTVSAPGLTEVTPGDSYSLTVTPAEGYEIASVTVDGEDATLTDGKLDIDNVDGNKVIEVKFNKLPEMVEVIEYVQELIILPWPAAIGIMAVFAAAVWGITKGVKALRRKAEEEGGY